ncbi:hypothetical protein Hanom_Chr02g00105971 [Helianthus anomalus]
MKVNPRSASLEQTQTWDSTTEGRDLDKSKGCRTYLGFSELGCELDGSLFIQIVE